MTVADLKTAQAMLESKIEYQYAKIEDQDAKIELMNRKLKYSTREKKAAGANTLKSLEDEACVDVMAFTDLPTVATNRTLHTLKFGELVLKDIVKEK